MDNESIIIWVLAGLACELIVMINILINDRLRVKYWCEEKGYTYRHVKKKSLFRIMLEVPAWAHLSLILIPPTALIALEGL